MSADEDIGNEIGKLILIGLVLVAGVVAFGVYAWHHFRFVS
ncbi:MAG: hypothetical protein JWL97_2960 [Gemmatimonadales bacterium]|nr:hypothetical protein [Gemmatimonadales bacterium]